MKAPLQLCLLCAVLALVAAPAAAQPVIGAILNNYSGTLPGLPNYGIAQGSIFQLWGTGMAAPGTSSSQNAPLQTTVAGVTLTVTVNGVVTHPPLYYVSPTQINGILPSATPVGTGTITVNNNNQTSAVFPIQVVQSAFGALSLNQAGTGPSAVLDVNYHLLSFTNAANPGDYLNFWGTGLGPISGNETIYPQTQTDLTNIPIEVDIGGVKATVTYHGRSQFPGLDQVQVKVPSGVSGCQVSVVVVSGAPSFVSNYGSIPVAASGRTCSDANTGFSASLLQLLSNKSTVSLGSVSMGKTTTTTQSITVGGITIPGSTTSSDYAGAVFYRYTAAQFQALAQSAVSIGSCTVFTYSGNSTSTNYNPFLPTYLNAGPVVNLSGPQGKQALTMQSLGIYYNSAAPSFIPASGGVFSFDNGSGGPDVGPFATSLNVAPPLTWTNMASITTVTRSQGVTVNWTGGDANTYVEIAGSSFAGLTSSSLVGGAFYCTAPWSAKTFTVPASVLLSLPASGSLSGFPLPGSLSVSNYNNYQTFTATGLDYGFTTFYNTNGISATYN